MRYSNKTVVQIGSHVGNTINDPIFAHVDETTRLILVEPVPFLFEQLKKNYENRVHHITFLSVLISDHEGEVEMTIPSPSNNFDEFPWWASQLGSVHPHHATAHIPHLKVETIRVPCISLATLIQDHGLVDIDFLHLDTEGHDYDILMHYDFHVKPRSIMFESKHTDGTNVKGSKYETLMKKLESMGYVMVETNGEDTTVELPRFPPGFALSP